MSRLDSYGHLESPKLDVPIEQLVNLIEDTNYGTQRFLSFLVKKREAEGDKGHTLISQKMIQEIRKYLEAGAF